MEKEKFDLQTRKKSWKLRCTCKTHLQTGNHDPRTAGSQQSQMHELRTVGTKEARIKKY